MGSEMCIRDSSELFPKAMPQSRKGKAPAAASDDDDDAATAPLSGREAQWQAGQVEMRGQHRSLFCPKPIYKTKTEDTKTPETTQRFGTLRHISKCKVPTTILTRNRVKSG
mgnify:CR=1 FL=1